MGAILQIRVYAYTYDEEEVQKAWPKLWKLAFEDYTPGFPMQTRGVLELVRALDELRKYGKLDSELEALLEGAVPDLMVRLGKLETFLADWRAKEANQQSVHLEDALTELEQKVPA